MVTDGARSVKAYPIVPALIADGATLMVLIEFIGITKLGILPSSGLKGARERCSGTRCIHVGAVDHLIVVVLLKLGFGRLIEPDVTGQADNESAPSEVSSDLYPVLNLSGGRKRMTAERDSLISGNHA